MLSLCPFGQGRGEDRPLNDFHESAPGTEDLVDRDAALIAAILRIGASLDLDTSCVRPSRGALYGAIYAPTVPDSPLDFITSGLTPEERNVGRVARRAPALRASARPRGAAEAAGPGGLRPLAGLLAAPAPLLGTDVTPGHAHGRLLPRGEGGRIHRPGRNGADACSHSRRRPSPTPVRTATSGAPGSTWRRRSRPRPSASWCSTPRPARRCPSTGRRSASWRSCARRAVQSNGLRRW